MKTVILSTVAAFLAGCSSFSPIGAPKSFKYVPVQVPAVEKKQIYETMKIDPDGSRLIQQTPHAPPPPPEVRRAKIKGNFTISATDELELTFEEPPAHPYLAPGAGSAPLAGGKAAGASDGATWPKVAQWLGSLGIAVWGALRGASL